MQKLYQILILAACMAAAVGSLILSHRIELLFSEQKYFVAAVSGVFFGWVLYALWSVRLRNLLLDSSCANLPIHNC